MHVLLEQRDRIAAFLLPEIFHGPEADAVLPSNRSCAFGRWSWAWSWASASTASITSAACRSALTIRGIGSVAGSRLEPETFRVRSRTSASEKQPRKYSPFQTMRTRVIGPSGNRVLSPVPRFVQRSVPWCFQPSVRECVRQQQWCRTGGSMPIGRPWTLRGAPLYWPSHKTMSIGLLDRCGDAIRIPM